jgi:hypothetical protein
MWKSCTDEVHARGCRVRTSRRRTRRAAACGTATRPSRPRTRCRRRARCLRALRRAATDCATCAIPARAGVQVCPASVQICAVCLHASRPRLVRLHDSAAECHSPGACAGVSALCYATPFICTERQLLHHNKPKGSTRLPSALPVRHPLALVSCFFVCMLHEHGSLVYTTWPLKVTARLCLLVCVQCATPFVYTECQLLHHNSLRVWHRH